MTVLPGIVRRTVTGIVLVTSLARTVAAIVVGLPLRLDGSPNQQTPRVAAFVAALASRTVLPIARMDERLTSREAEVLVEA